MTGRSKGEALALYEGRALREQKAAIKARAVKRAADNVEDKSCESVSDAARGQGVSEESVRIELRRRKALRDAGMSVEGVDSEAT